LIIAGGGTGGHLFPALAIADEVRNLRPNATIVFIGTKGRIEARLVPQEGYPIRTIWAGGIRRTFSLSNLLVPAKILVSFVQSFFIIKQVKPDVVVGTGGYVCGPVLIAARLQGIPTVIHESNSLPGITTRLLAGSATKVFLGFEDAMIRLKRTDNNEVVGTPTRAGLLSASRDEAVRTFKLNSEKDTVLVVGGSQGAVSLNQAVLLFLPRL